jgi:hypothetical protein
MLGTSGLVAVAVLAVGLNVADIARVVRQQGPMPGAGGRAISTQAWTPPVEDPADREKDRNDAYLQRKAAERERRFQQQQRQQADDRRDLRLELRLDADRRMERDRRGWPGR